MSWKAGTGGELAYNNMTLFFYVTVYFLGLE